MFGQSFKEFSILLLCSFLLSSCGTEQNNFGSAPAVPPGSGETGNEEGQNPGGTSGLGQFSLYFHLLTKYDIGDAPGEPNEKVNGYATAATFQILNNQLSLPDEILSLNQLFGLSNIRIQQNDWVRHGSCTIPLDTQERGVGSNITCNFKVPESELFHSAMGVVWGTDRGIEICSTKDFHPYYYIANDSDTDANFFWDGNSDGTDCTDHFADGTPTAANCYNGAAKLMVPNPGNFPEVTSIRTSVAQDPSTPTVGRSGHFYMGGLAAPSNRYASNALVDRATSLPTFSTGTTLEGHDGYVGNSMQDYVIQCRDPFHELNYQITVIISDWDFTADSDNPVGVDNPDDINTNHYGDWDSSNEFLDPQP